MIHRMNDDECRKVLHAGRVARLGCIANAEPYIVPISYEFDGDFAYSHSLPGLKIDALRKNARACLQVDDIQADLQWRSVLAYGNYEEILNQSERRDVLGRLLRRFPALTPVESALVVDGIPPQVIVFRIRIDRLTGMAEA